MKNNWYKILQRLILLLCLTVSLYSYSQSSQFVKKSYAYFFENRRNNFPKHGDDEEIFGKKDSLKTISLPPVIDTFIVVYIETKSKMISWDTAWQNDQAFQITALPIKQIPFQAGFEKGGSQIVLTPKKGNFLWQLQFSLINSLKNLPRKITKDRIMLNGRDNGRKFSFKTSGLKEIVPLPPA
jgi:hypothetical protein